MSVPIVVRPSCRPQLGAPRAALLLPFLYRTRTISRCYATVGDEVATKYRPSQIVDAAESDVPAARRRASRAGEKDRSLGRDQPTRASNYTGQSSSPRLRAQESTRTSPPAYEDVEKASHVPFEGGYASLRDPAERLKGTTMTPKELAIFKNLFRVKQASAEIKADINRTSAPREFPEPLRSLAEEAQALRAGTLVESAEEATEYALQRTEAAERWLSKITKDLDDAPNDGAVWQYMQDKVFKKVKMLRLDDAVASQATVKSQKNEALIQAFPAVLLHFMDMMLNQYRGSSFGLLLLPTLKKLGPTTLTMGGTTSLYNKHMQILLRQYSDLDSIADLLAEMDKEVYHFNIETGKLLDDIFDTARKAQAGQLGPGLQALWSTGRRVRALDRLRGWRKIVQEHVSAIAIRRARQREADLVGAEHDFTHAVVA